MKLDNERKEKKNYVGSENISYTLK